MANYWTPIQLPGWITDPISKDIPPFCDSNEKAVSDPNPNSMFGSKCEPYSDAELTLVKATNVLSIVGAVTGAYHGYERNNQSFVYGALWGLFGGLFPWIEIPISLYQGLGKPVNVVRVGK